MNIFNNIKKNARLLSYTFVILCFCSTASGQVLRVKDTLKQKTRGIKNNTVANENNRNEEAEKAAWGARLAKELKDIGVPISESELKAIENALMRGGNGAMAIAMFIVNSIAEVKKDHNIPANTANSPQTFTPEQAKVLLEKLKERKADSLSLMKFVKPRIEKLRN